MHQIGEQHILVFLVQFLLVLATARGLGSLARRIGQPALLGEIMAGVILGPTILGRVAPGWWAALFPSDPIQMGMLETISWVGLFLLLLSVGLEVDVSTVWRQKGDALKISVSDIILPMVVAFVPALFLPERYLGSSDNRLLFAFFIATVSTISALPMSVRVLHDLDLLKTDLGLLTISALTINDLIGWGIFTVLLGFTTQQSVGAGHVAGILGATVLFAAFCLTIGRWLVSHGIAGISRWRLADAGLVLTFVCCLGILSGTVTQWLGIHALFGFFLAGIMAGDSPALSERTRQVIGQMVYAVFVPVFFASIGLRVDFIGNFDFLLAGLLTVVGIGGRYLGAWVGARATTLSAFDRVTIAIAHTPGGSMEMILALVAWQYGLITLPVFVAVVFAAMASSVLLGPWMAWSVRRRHRIDVPGLFLRPAARLALRGATRSDVLRELAEAAADNGIPRSADDIFDAVRTREETAGTALGQNVAVPHARLDGLPRPAIVMGRTPAGVEWNSPDGLPVRLVFLVLTPPEAHDQQVQILAFLARTLNNEQSRRLLLEAETETVAWNVLHQAMMQQEFVRKT